MCFQGIFSGEWLVTEWTVKSEFLCLVFRNHMSPEGVFVCKSFTTQATWVFVDSTMRVFVNPQIVMSGECFPTNRTWETSTRNLQTRNNARLNCGIDILHNSTE